EDQRGAEPEQREPMTVEEAIRIARGKRIVGEATPDEDWRTPDREPPRRQRAARPKAEPPVDWAPIIQGAVRAECDAMRADIIREIADLSEQVAGRVEHDA